MMGKAEILIYLILNAARSMLAVRLLSVFLTKKRKQSVLCSLTVAYWIFNSIGYLYVQNEWVNLATNVGGLFFVAIIGYSDRVRNRLLIIVLDLTTGVIAENLAYALFVRKGGEVPVAEINILSVLVFYLLLVLLERTVAVYKDQQTSFQNHVFLFLIAAGMLVIGYVLVDFVDGSYVMKQVSLLILLLICLSIYYLYDSLGKAYAEAKEKELYALQVGMYKEQLEVMKHVNEANRFLRHDLKHHVIMIDGYLQKGEQEKAMTYIRKISELSENGEGEIHSGNEIIDSVVNYFCREIRRCGGDLGYEINVPEQLHIADYDINVILANLLSNMSEALSEAEEKEGHLRIVYDRNLLRIVTMNRYHGSLFQTDGIFQTGKKDRNEHGIGLKSVRRTVEKYDGGMKVKAENGNFQVEIWMYDA